MLTFLRLFSLVFLVAVAIVLGTLWAKVLGGLLGGGGLVLFVLVPIPVLGGIFLLGYWIDGYLARMARQQARYRRPPRD